MARSNRRREVKGRGQNRVRLPQPAIRQLQREPVAPPTALPNIQPVMPPPVMQPVAPLSNLLGGSGSGGQAPKFNAINSLQYTPEMSGTAPPDDGIYSLIEKGGGNRPPRPQPTIPTQTGPKGNYRLNPDGQPYRQSIEPSNPYAGSQFEDMPQIPRMITHDMQMWTNPITGKQESGSGSTQSYQNRLKQYFDANPGAQDYYNSLQPPAPVDDGTFVPQDLSKQLIGTEIVPPVVQQPQMPPPVMQPPMGLTREELETGAYTPIPAPTVGPQGEIGATGLAGLNEFSNLNPDGQPYREPEYRKNILQNHQVLPTVLPTGGASPVMPQQPGQGGGGGTGGGRGQDRVRPLFQPPVAPPTALPNIQPVMPPPVMSPPQPKPPQMPSTGPTPIDPTMPNAWQFGIAPPRVGPTPNLGGQPMPKDLRLAGSDFVTKGPRTPNTIPTPTGPIGGMEYPGGGQPMPTDVMPTSPPEGGGQGGFQQPIADGGDFQPVAAPPVNQDGVVMPTDTNAGITGINNPVPGQINPVMLGVTQDQRISDPNLREAYFGSPDTPGFLNQATQAAQKSFLDQPAILRQTAGLSPLEIQAMQQAQAGIGSYQPYLDAQQSGILEGMGMSRRAGQIAQPYFAGQEQYLGGSTEQARQAAGMQFDPSTMTQAYFDPFEDRVVQQTIDDVFKQGDIADVAQRARDIQSGGQSAFGSRARLTADERRASLGRGLGEALAGIRSGGYRNAQSAAMGEFGKQRQARQRYGDTLSGLGTQLGGIGATRSALARGIGSDISQYGGQIGGLGGTQYKLGAQQRGELTGLGGLARGVKDVGLGRQYERAVQDRMAPTSAASFVGGFLPKYQPGFTDVHKQYGIPADPLSMGLGTIASTYANFANPQRQSQYNNQPQYNQPQN